MSSKRLFAAGLSLVLIASPALAQSRGTLELGALGAYTKFDNAYLFDNGGGIGGRFGVFLHPMFAVEAEGSYMDIDRGGAFNSASTMTRPTIRRCTSAARRTFR